MIKESSAVIVAVGTELTSGELVDTNSAWISQKLEDKGLRVVSHKSVPDDHALMLEAFKQSEELADFVFVTGGLGPTKDDFTRNVVADWLDRPLKENDNSLNRIKGLFEEMNRTFYDFQAQQALFPEGASVLTNNAGTADAFYIEKDRLKVFILPGPPREISAVWKDHVDTLLNQKVTTKKEKELRSWLCFGEGESKIANIVEKTLRGLPFETGYRAHAPYIEVKIWGEDFASHSELATLDKALSKYLMSRERRAYSQNFVEGIADRVRVFDGVSQGELHANLLKARQKQEFEVVTSLSEKRYSEAEAIRFSEADFYVLHAEKDGEYWVGSNGKLSQEVFEAEGIRRPRFMNYWAAEKACQIWSNASTSS